MKKLKFEIIIVSLAILFLIGQSINADTFPLHKHSLEDIAAIRIFADEQIKIAMGKIGDVSFIKDLKEDVINLKNVKLPQIVSQFNRIESDLANLKQENQSLKTRIEKLENKNISIPVSSVETKAVGYYQYEGKPEIYESGTNRHIGFIEATQKNIWKDIKIIK